MCCPALTQLKVEPVPKIKQLLAKLESVWATYFTKYNGHKKIRNVIGIRVKKYREITIFVYFVITPTLIPNSLSFFAVEEAGSGNRDDQTSVRRSRRLGRSRPERETSSSRTSSPLRRKGKLQPGGKQEIFLDIFLLFLLLLNLLLSYNLLDAVKGQFTKNTIK